MIGVLTKLLDTLSISLSKSFVFVAAKAWVTSSWEMTSMQEPTQPVATGNTARCGQCSRQACKSPPRLLALFHASLLRQKAKENELPITAKGEEGKSERGQRERAKEGRRVRRTGKMQILYYNTEHTHTHTQISGNTTRPLLWEWRYMRVALPGKKKNLKSPYTDFE